MVISMMILEMVCFKLIFTLDKRNHSYQCIFELISCFFLQIASMTMTEKRPAGDSLFCTLRLLFITFIDGKNVGVDLSLPNNQIKFSVFCTLFINLYLNC